MNYVILFSDERWLVSDTSMSSNPISRLLPSSAGGASSQGQDNMSKLLPQVPDMDTQLQLAAKMIDKKTATHKVSYPCDGIQLYMSLW